MLNQVQRDEFNKLKQEILTAEFAKMNDMQRQAVFTVNGPLLILAGAGSGKTTVIVNRIAYMVKYGNAFFSTFVNADFDESHIDFLKAYKNHETEDSEKLCSMISNYPIRPWNILAITFTNKAAGELKERLEKSLGDTALDVNAGTFHSICVRILRREIERLGYGKSFTIYDTDDSVRVIKDAIRSVQVDDKQFPPKAILGEISRCKDKMISPAEALKNAGDDYRKKVIAQIYGVYQNRLKQSNAVDFDDIIVLSVKLLSDYPEVLEFYHNRYKYVLVDEYQDTNQSQYKLVSLLTCSHENICVVGDDDQSIYRFRGATIENILSFENQFDNATVIRLEQNYRSTQNILSSANAVISQNANRKGKSLWTDSGDGEKIKIYRARDEFDEASYVANAVSDHIANGGHYNDHAVLYRMNAQSNNIERHFVRMGIPYKIIGGTKFFERKEIKDMIAYFSVINNQNDLVRLKRIINEPKRGIGDSTIAKAEYIAQGLNIPLFEVLKTPEDFEDLSRKSTSLTSFANLIEEFSNQSEELSLDGLLDIVLEKTGYERQLLLQGDEGKTRLENINELRTNLIKYEQENDEPTLSGFLEEVSLFTDLDNMNVSDDSVLMMTLHSAKGLEFPNVFIIGMEENIFPGRMSINTQADIEEERRLAYVGITRAKEHLHITNASQRMLFGITNRNPVSRFIQEIPQQFVDFNDPSLSIQKSNTSYGSSQVTTSSGGFGYSNKRAPHFNVSSVGDTNKSKAAVQIDYHVGDKVNHKMFGDGVVLSLKPMANDMLVEVAFDKVGTKKIMANFSKLQKNS